jgi:hypothetical protein
MQVASYQMHNVLECYSKKLSQTSKNTKPATDPQANKGTEDLLLSPEMSRMATMDKISQQILDKVTDVVALSHTPPVSRTEAQEKSGDGPGAQRPATEEFIYNVIDSINRKRTARLTMGDPAALARRVD